MERNIYKIGKELFITSDEELVLGGYHFNSKYGDEPQKTNQRDIDSKKYWKEEDYYITKIILTTDQDLIKDGVQAIDDEFLEWFVKNPSCEEIRIIKTFEDYTVVGGKSDEIYYKIIIKKEESKQETLEEAIERLYGDGTDCEGDIIKSAIRVGRIDAFYDATKWQQERSYSEQEVLVLLHNRDKHSMDKSLTFSSWQNPKDWFEQFKKK
jgi:hypothetical protein